MSEKQERMENFEEYLDISENSPGQVVEVTVTRINPAEGISVDFGGKQEGMIPQNELVRPATTYTLGEKIKAQILKINDEEGYAILSERRPFAREVRNSLKKAYETKTPIKGKIVQVVSGGYQVDIQGVLSAFLPGSHSLLRKDQAIPDEEMEFLIIEYTVDRKRQRVVVSRRELVEQLRRDFFNSHRVGDEVHAVVEQIAENHAILDLGIVKAFLPRTELSHDPSISFADILKKGEKIKTKIIELDETKGSVTVSLKALEPDPWLRVSEKYPVGTIVQGAVKSILPFGVFINLEPGLDGLIHISEIFWGSKKADLHKYFKVGQLVQAEVVEIDPEKRRISLSYKKAKGDPWENVAEKYPEGSVVSGVVQRVLSTGAIVEIEDGVSGFVPKSELSWNKIKDPSEIVKEKQRVDVKILSIDQQQRRMRLSIKQLTSDPWEEVLTKLSEDSVVKATVKSKVNSGFIVFLNEFSVEGLMPSGHAHEDLKEGDEVEVLVLRLIPERRKVLVSQKKLEEKRAYEDYKKTIGGDSNQKTLGDRMKG